MPVSEPPGCNMAAPPDTSHWADDLALILGAAQAAGDVAMSHFGQSPEVWWKNEGSSPVSAADYAANAVLEERLRAARPAYGWLSEETEDDQARLSCETVFVVDPIDGTRAFIGGRKTWCVSVAVVHAGQPVAGVLVAPALDEIFTATAEGPACRNGVVISVSAANGAGKLRLASAQDMIAGFSADFRPQIERVEHIPSLAYRLALVADGRIDGTLVKRNAHDWDLAAADLILTRAGGRLTDLAGERPFYNRQSVIHPELCAASEHLMPIILGNITRI